MCTYVSSRSSIHPFIVCVFCCVWMDPFPHLLAAMRQGGNSCENDEMNDDIRGIKNLQIALLRKQHILVPSPLLFTLPCRFETFGAVLLLCGVYKAGQPALSKPIHSFIHSISQTIFLNNRKSKRY